MSQTSEPLVERIRGQLPRRIAGDPGVFLPHDDWILIIAALEAREWRDSSSTAWLIERRVTPPQWSSERAPTGVSAFWSDPHRAHRFTTEAEAEEAMRRMAITPKERGEYFVSEYCWIGDALRAGVIDEDWLEEVISDSVDMDWRPRDAAKLIIARFKALPTPATEGEA